MTFNSLKTKKESVNWDELIEHVEKKYGYDIRDMAGKYSKESTDKRDQILKDWLKEHNLEDKEYVLHQKDAKTDWPLDSEEIKLRIKIVTESDYFNKWNQMYPYQDVWHWLLDNDFVEIHNGCYAYLNLNPEEFDENIPDYVKKVLTDIREEVKDNPAFNGSELYVWIEW